MNLQEILNEYFIVSGGEIKNKVGRKTAQTSDQVKSKVDSVNDDFSGREIREAMQVFIESETESARSLADDFEAYDTPIDFIQHVIDSNGFIIDITGDNIQLKTDDGQPIQSERSFLETQVLKRMYEYNRSIPLIDNKPITHGYKTEELKTVIDHVLELKKIETVVALRDDLKYDPGVNLDIVLRATLKMMKIQGDIEVNVTVFKHWLWGIKRHVFGLPVKSELWLAFYGGQNTGKSHFVKEVLAPPLMGKCQTNAELNIISKLDQNIGTFKNNFLVNFEELARGDGKTADSQLMVGGDFMATLKAMLTAEDIRYRPYHTQRQAILKKSFACMSTANNHIYDVLNDPTGMRRFFEFQVMQPRGVLFDRPTMAKLERDGRLFYTGIDENNEVGYLLNGSDIWKKVQVIQETYKGKSSIDNWILDGEYEIEPEDDEGSETATLSELYESYRSYCNSGGLKPFSKPNFTKGIEERYTVTKPQNRKSLRVIIREI
tara:strand:- start:4188 stop:5660 length:1473 start_codon:yes stop_codon:yes gene_type:complete